MKQSNRKRETMSSELAERGRWLKRTQSNWISARCSRDGLSHIHMALDMLFFYSYAFRLNFYLYISAVTTTWILRISGAHFAQSSINISSVPFFIYQKSLQNRMDVFILFTCTYTLTAKVIYANLLEQLKKAKRRRTLRWHTTLSNIHSFHSTHQP